MQCYFIEIINKQITTYEVIDANFEVLKKNGENNQKYDELSYWEWFKNKIEYNNEPLSFIILSDKEEFLVDDKIKISKVNSFSMNDLAIKSIQEQSIGLNMISYPTFEDFNMISLDTEQEKRPRKIELNADSHNNIANYFRNETKRYKNE